MEIISIIWASADHGLLFVCVALTQAGHDAVKQDLWGQTLLKPSHLQALCRIVVAFPTNLSVTRLHSCTSSPHQTHNVSIGPTRGPFACSGPDYLSSVRLCLFLLD